MPAIGIRKSSSSSVPFPPSGAIPKSRSKKSTHFFFLERLTPSEIVQILYWAESKDPLFEILFGQAGH